MNPSYRVIYDALLDDISACGKRTTAKEIECRFRTAEASFSQICRMGEKGFSGVDDEIRFFRQTKPLFLVELLYWQLVNHFFLFCSPDSETYLPMVYREKNRLPQLAHHHAAFYTYMVSGNQELDKRYFTTSRPVCVQPLPLYYGGKQPNSSHDLVWASLLTLQRYNDFLDQRLAAS